MLAAVEREPTMLTEREREIATLIALGHTTSEIAERLGISPRTVETYRLRIAAKLGPKRVAIVRWAIAEGVFEGEPA
jgi:DNA-binding CsgD family transcriptional regulator